MKKGYKHSEKTKQKIREASLKRYASGEKFGFQKGHKIGIGNKWGFQKGHPALKTAFQKGSIPWNKDKKCPQISITKKGKPNPVARNNPQVFKKGHIPWHKDKKRPEISGEKHWNYKGTTPINIKIRQSLEYKLWRKAVFERDNFTCQKYGIKGGKLHPHHINNFADYPELRLAIDNGITLSDKAHREFHHKYGNKYNTKGQIEEFLKNNN